MVAASARLLPLGTPLNTAICGRMRTCRVVWGTVTVMIGGDGGLLDPTPIDCLDRGGSLSSCHVSFLLFVPLESRSIATTTSVYIVATLATVLIAQKVIEI